MFTRSVTAELAFGQGVAGEFQNAANVLAEARRIVVIVTPVCEMFCQGGGITAMPGYAGDGVGCEVFNRAQLIVFQTLIESFCGVMGHDDPFLVRCWRMCQVYLKLRVLILQAQAGMGLLNM